MNLLQRSIRSVTRKPVKSLLLFLTVMVISTFFMAALSSRSASIQTQDSTRQAVGATFRLELNDQNREERLDEAAEKLNEGDGEYQGVHVETLDNGSILVSTDNSFETIKMEDVEKLADVAGIQDYNLITAITAVNPVNFQRVEDSEKDQSSDLGGITLKGNRKMEMDMDISAGKIEITEGRMADEKDENVCVISQELAGLNNLTIGDELEFNNVKDKENSEVFSAKIIGIYKAVQPIEPLMSGDTYRPENTIYTDISFPEKPSGEEGNPLYEYAIFQVEDVDEYDTVRERLQATDINWGRYDLIDNNGNIKNMAANFSGMKNISDILLYVVAIAGFVMLALIFLFWMKNRKKEIGIFMALGMKKSRSGCSF